MNKLINVGYENTVNMEKVISITNAKSSPTRRMIQRAKEKDLLVDATEGKKTVTAIVMESGHVILSAVRIETLKKRIG
ncbi:DUF370 domain-containing protein [Clostridium septicum]|uniref:DUF370 domain-containing protein n=1 Tax=Clostridium septicum TaxID=1504 RepID=A0A9N7JP72_CLOSE|nr:DUF370 domain-containing protein [Clostridium septicum]AYE35679.1 DUF370 domain-containing protein [Clostridium septicum]UEC19646.1 DUF370 domain-containing protein [Clostridium septicum]USS02293.1 DUF370 domain-containing protein [Clostridium septicum]WLF70876.1 DUF370 domain-containing protein [Clostridium septicum]